MFNKTLGENTTVTLRDLARTQRNAKQCMAQTHDCSVISFSFGGEPLAFLCVLLAGMFKNIIVKLRHLTRTGLRSLLKTFGENTTVELRHLIRTQSNGTHRMAQNHD